MRVSLLRCDHESSSGQGVSSENPTITKDKCEKYLHSLRIPENVRKLRECTYPPPCPTNTVSNEHYPFEPYFLCTLLIRYIIRYETSERIEVSGQRCGEMRGCCNVCCRKL